MQHPSERTQIPFSYSIFSFQRGEQSLWGIFGLGYIHRETLHRVTLWNNLHVPQFVRLHHDHLFPNLLPSLLLLGFHYDLCPLSLMRLVPRSITTAKA